MISRRSVLASGSAAAFMARARADQGVRTAFQGPIEQGRLVVGEARHGGSLVTVDQSSSIIGQDGLFVFGVPYDAVKPIHVSVLYLNGKETFTLDVVTREYDIQKIDGLDEKYVEPPPEISERIAREHARITEARKRETPGSDFATPIEWPCAGRLSGVYGSQRILNGKPMAPHLGVDVAAPEGTPIHAAADGIVAITDEFYLEGGFTLLDHGHGVNSCYLHQSKRLVRDGEAVKRGQIIGHIGHTGRATGPHTHWGLNWFQMKLDPSRATREPVPPKG